MMYKKFAAINITITFENVEGKMVKNIKGTNITSTIPNSSFNLKATTGSCAKSNKEISDMQ